MFSKTTKKRMKRILLFKYFFQFFIAPLILGILFNLIAIAILIIRDGFSNAVLEVFIEKIAVFGIIHMSGWFLIIIIAFIFNLVNILSVLPYIKLILDCFTKKDEESKEIELDTFYPYYELQCIRQSKRFMCDTFSRKKNAELFLYDENKNKYRLLWNEKYGDDKLEEVLDASKLRISYFKHSKIIFNVEVIA